MKKILTFLIGGACLIGAWFFFQPGAEKKSVKIANMNWASAGLMANIDKIVLEKGFGFNVELIQADTVPAFTSMNEKGSPDIVPELWANSFITPLNKAIEEGRLHRLNKGPITGLGEGWWVTPAFRKKHPEIKTVMDLLKRPDLFPHPEDKSKGGFVTCPAGWACQLSNANLFRAFEMEKKGWKLIDPGSAAGLDGTIAKAAERGQNWVGYYWAPTAMIGKYNLVKLDWGIPFAGKENWDGCIAKPEKDCANPKPTAWITPAVNTVVTDKFMKNADKNLITYFEKRTYPGKVMNGMLVYMTENQADGSVAAIEFFKKHEDVWTKWLPTDVADKIKKSL
jgi:glycine betaine/proline transport system substrate-binding protein